MFARRTKLTAAIVGRLYQARERFSVQLVRLTVASLTLAGFGGSGVYAQEAIDPRLEYNVKAVSLYAFGRYVTWPDTAFDSASSPFVIGTFGGNPFGDALQRIAKQKTLNGRTIEVRQISRPEECVGCHILFVPSSVSRESESKLFEQAAGKPVLLVGESPGFATRGGVINFYHSGTNVRFELNPDKSLENRLSLNAKLLTLGTRAATRK